MKPLFTLLLWLPLAAASLHAQQEATLRVLGKYAYTEQATHIVYVLGFAYNPEVCNPVTQNKTIDIQIQEFEGFLQEQKAVYQLFPQPTPTTDDLYKKKYVLELPLTSSFSAIQRRIQTSGIEMDCAYFKYKATALAEQDEKAILALQNASQKAHNLAKLLNYQIIETLNIDDDTSDDGTTNFLGLALDDIDEYEKDVINTMLAQLEATQATANPTRAGGYNLWVTYRLKPL